MGCKGDWCLQVMRDAGARTRTGKCASARVSCVTTAVAGSSVLTAFRRQRRRETTLPIRSGLLLSADNRGMRKVYRVKAADWSKAIAGRNRVAHRNSSMAFYCHFEIVLRGGSGF